jgi:hypothetical protein
MKKHNEYLTWVWDEWVKHTIECSQKHGWYDYFHLERDLQRNEFHEYCLEHDFIHRDNLINWSLHMKCQTSGCEWTCGANWQTHLVMN